jgi:hypothetical protein
MKFSAADSGSGEYKSFLDLLEILREDEKLEKEYKF